MHAFQKQHHINDGKAGDCFKL